MADAADTMRYLVKNIDTALAGTREEGQASKNLSKIFHEHGLESAEQNFKYSSFGDVPQAACLGLLGIVSLISGAASGAFLVVLFIIGLALAGLYAAELYGIKTVSRIGMSEPSQNVIACHPAASTMNGQKARPVVIIAHYDTPRSDILSTPAIAGFRQYIRTAVLVCAIADVVAMFMQVLPLPTPLQSVAYAVAVIASIVLIAWTVCVVLQRFVMPPSPAANDNKASIAAMFGLLDRVRPLKGGVGSGPNDTLLDAMGYEDGSSVYAAVEDPDAARIRVSGRNHPVVEQEEHLEEETPSRPRRSRASRLRANTPVRYGADVVKSLGILPESCVLEYEAPQAEEGAKATPASVSGQVHHVGVGSEASKNAAVAVDGETLLMSPVTVPDATSEQQQLPLAAEEPATPAEPVVLDPEAMKDAAAEAIMAGIVGSNTLSGSQAPDPAANGATSLIQPVAQPVQNAQPAQPFNVITSSDDYDVELSGGVSQMPLDVAAQTAQDASSYIADDFDDSPSASVVNSPEWGTSSFVPVASNRSILGNIPDPAVAAVDPFSVSSIETVGNYNPDDFSELDFETGTHQAVTPNMLEYERRRALDGFSADITENVGKRGRKGKKNKGRQGRIGHQAAQMQQQMQESSFNDWLGLDENYNAKTNGEQIGSWDNFADDASAGQHQYGQQGQYGQQYGQDGGQYGQQQNPRWQGGAARARRAPRREGEEAAEAVETRRAAMTLGDRDLISHEIWFVLTGASEAGHAGVEEFLKMYRQDLRGAYFINLECVGAGKPSLIIEEGLGRHVKADRRLVNLFGNASLGINRPLALARMKWSDTEASTLLRQGCRAVSVVGMEKGAPAHARWVADTPDKVNLDQINDLVDILVEVIKEA